MTADRRRAPAAPKGLGSEGRRLWRDIHRDFEFDPFERRYLLAAARLADEIAVMEEALDAEGPLVAGSRGQLVANPLLSELRAHRAELARQLALAGVVAEAPALDSVVKSAAGRALALQRWRGGGGG